MASHIPLALSLLSTVANHYPGLQKSAPNPPSVVPAAAPLQNATNAPAPSAPVSIPGAMPNNAPAPNGPNATPSTSPPTIKPSALCVHCQLRPKYFDGSKTHPYCSKTCANKVKAGVGSATTSVINGPAPSGNCDFCHNRPKYSDGTRVHPFCSKACAKNANGPQRKGSTASASTNKVVCQAPGCQNPPHAHSNGSVGDYCSVAHKTSDSTLIGESLCLMCLQAPKMANSHFCGQICADNAEKKGPMILEVPTGHVTFKSVADQFKASWRHVGTVCPPVRRVYKIMAPQASLASYNAYKAAVESRGQFVAAGRSAGNENRRWHGTRRECNFGDKGQTQFCSSSSCSLCCIVRTSFDLSLWGKKTGWGRFGKGIYTSSTSSKSNDYSHNDCKSPLKAILLNKVVVGKGCKMLQDSTSLTSPPSGYDSVLAEKGGSLNYDELVVYTNDAIRPSFLVMYEP
ncbi:hypothetical protein BDQ12DRAFT_754834 [Crucibulum laeve]|uniref:PARP catalytic domain-containing protein n=1 Tax=Crucibulum laeve TaxID=68775 RepID=A0A5C3LVB8_9AGAR|nr:hypothetical protein BDQ12DRAFT_754834 [Crucibulum laeve]